MKAEADRRWEGEAEVWREEDVDANRPKEGVARLLEDRARAANEVPGSLRAMRGAKDIVGEGKEGKGRSWFEGSERSGCLLGQETSALFLALQIRTISVPRASPRYGRIR